MKQASKSERLKAEARERKKNWQQIAKLAKCYDPDAPRPAYLVQALKRIGVSVAELDKAPPITPLLKLAHNGLPQVIEAMRLAQGDDNITPFLTRYDSLSASDRRIIPFEAVALAAGVDIRKLLGSIMYALQQQSVSLVRLLTTSSHPEVVKARIKYARLPGGHQDRQALDTALGLLPPPRGGATFINTATILGSGRDVMDSQGSGKGANAKSRKDDADDIIDGEDPENIDLDKLFPSPRIMQERLVEIREKVKALPPIKSETDKIQ
jgi:hypothetical protein